MLAVDTIYPDAPTQIWQQRTDAHFKDSGWVWRDGIVTIRQCRDLIDSETATRMDFVS
jgi:hypothetical protein